MLISHAPTAAIRTAAFPADEPLDPGGRAAADYAGQGFTGGHREPRGSGRPPGGTHAGSQPCAEVGLSSPALCCRQTASALGLTVTVDDALRDADPGRWAGRTVEDVAAADPAAVAAWLAGAAPPGGESADDVRQRAAGWLARRDGYTVAVTHAAVIRALVGAVLDAPAATARRIEVPPLTRTELRGGPGRWAVRMLGGPVGCG